MPPPIRPGAVVRFFHATAAHRRKDRPGAVVEIRTRAGTAIVVPGLGEPPDHDDVVEVPWTEAVAATGLVHDTYFDLRDPDEVPLSALERAGRINLPPEVFRAIEDGYRRIARDDES
jgi:hypothetical protein